ncbi:hypothetical protein L596_013705 [Steinernema carpocapsae]|nr:hypothetical protein L596_013705 [Steinernema carpocapsae]
MVIGDLMVVLAQLCVAVPIMYAGHNVFKDAKLFPYILTLVDSYGYLSNMYFGLLLIINRFCIFCIPRINGSVFGKRSVLRPSCKGAGDVARSFSRFGMYEGYVLPGIMFILYIAVLVKIKYEFRVKVGVAAESQTQSTKAKMELRLLLQSMIICGVLQIEALSFALLPKIRLPMPAQGYLNVMIGLLSLVNSGTHPVVLFVFNTDVKQGLQNLLKKGTTVQTLSMSQSISVKKPQANLANMSRRRGTVISVC